MECRKCGTKWEASREISKSLTVCPFCGKSLAKEEEPRFYDNSRDALAAIMRMYGTDVLLGKLNAHFPDFAPSVSAGDKRLVYAVYELGAAQVLKNNLTTPQAEKERAIKIAARKLTDAFIVPDKAETIVYEFAAALGWQVCKPEQSAPPPKPPEPQQSKPNNIVPQPSLQPQAAVQSNTSSVKVPSRGASGIVAEILQGEKRDIQFGAYKWRVLDVQGDKALMITEGVVEKRPYNDAWIGVTWETCTLRKYLNGEFLQKFTEEERRKITETQIRNPDNLWCGTEGGRDTVDKVFLLSLEEVDRYFGDSGDYKNKRGVGKYYFSNAHDSDRQAKFGKEVCWWWLRSPGDLSDLAAYVDDDGYVYVIGGSVGIDSGGVRPAFWLNLKS